MKKEDYSTLLSASDLSGHLACAHLVELNLLAHNGTINFPRSQIRYWKFYSKEELNSSTIT